MKKNLRKLGFRACKMHGSEKMYQLRAIWFSEDQLDSIVPALELAKELTGSDKIPWLIDVICMTFLSAYIDDKEKTLKWWMANIERVWGVKLVAFKADEVLYGVDVYKKIMESE